MPQSPQCMFARYSSCRFTIYIFISAVNIPEGMSVTGAAQSPTVIVTVGQYTPKISIEITPDSGLAPLPVVITGQMTDPNGNGVPNQPLFMNINGQASGSSAVTDANGNYKMSYTFPGNNTYSCYVYFNGFTKFTKAQSPTVTVGLPGGYHFCDRCGKPL